MKRTNLIKYLFSIFFFLLLASGTATVSFAAGEDPGAGRLSGKVIPKEFYDTDTDFMTIQPFQRYGGFTTSSSYTSQTYTHSDIFSERTILHGIDVSQWQGSIDWKKVKAAGIDYAFIRVGYRGYGSAGTLNETTKDSYFDTNMKNAIAAGVNVGVYIFSQAITPDEAKAEAQYILDHIGNYSITMPLVLDFEYASDASDGGRLYKAKLSKDAATNICMAFCETISSAGYTPMVYANKSMLENQLNAATISAAYPIWLANYTTNTTYGGTYDFWQYSSTGKVSGISGNVDMNFYYAQPDDNFSSDPDSIASAVIEPIPDQTYTGSAITPSFTLTYSGKVLVQGEDYTVTYQNNKNIGTATITITGMNTYSGIKTATFRIIPKTMSAVKASKRSTNSITLSWSKDNNADGYQIYRSTSPNGTYKKIATITKKSTTTYQNTKLTSGQCYYYKICSYKTIDKTTYCGALSSVKSIYTKTGYTRLAIAKSGVRIYDTASTSGTVLASPSKNASMTVTYSTLDDSGSTWYYVTYKSQKGYVPANKVQTAKQGVVKNSKVNVRKSNTTKSKRLTTLNKNKKVTVLTTKKKKGVTWYKVTFKKSSKTYTGWISAPYVKIK